MKATPPAATSQAGFTLVELLAALAIAIVVLVGIAGLIRNVGLSFERGTRGVADAERLLLAVGRLAADFGSARFILRRKEPGAVAALFTGRPDAVVFVTAGHPAIGTRDEEMVFLKIEDLGDTARLVRRRAVFPGLRAPLDAVVPDDPVVLLEGPAELAFAFAADSPTGPPRWTDRWIDEALPPRRVRLIIRNRAGGADLLAPVVFSIRADAPPSCAASGATACLPAVPDATAAPSAAPAEKPQ